MSGELECSYNEAVSKLEAYKDTFGSWILTASVAKIHSQERLLRDAAMRAREDDDLVLSNTLISQAVQLAAVGRYVTIRNQHQTQPAEQQNTMSEETQLEIREKYLDVMDFDEDRVIEEVTALATKFGGDVLILTPDEYRKLALESLTTVSKPINIIDAMDSIVNAIECNYIARVLQRAEDLDIDVQEAVNPPALSLKEITTNTVVPKFEIGQTVYHCMSQEIEGEVYDIVNSVQVIGYYTLNNIIKYRIGTLDEDGDTIYPIDDFIDADELHLTAPSTQTEKRKRHLRSV